MRSIRFTEKTLTRALTAGVLMGSLFLPFSAGAASPERTAESKSVPAATVSAQEKVSQEKIVKENLKIEMYPLYWTPSKEGTFCVIRLNLS